MGINGVHSFTVSPEFAKHGIPFYMQEFEVMTMIMSALAWRAHNGSIRLYADPEFAKWVYENNLDFLWDGGIDIHLFENISPKINRKIFWAATKIDVFKEMKVGEVHIDIDFIMWGNVKEKIKDGDVVVSHYEDINLFTCYIPKEQLSIPENYIFPKNLDWNFPAINTSFIVFNSQNAKDLFCKECIRYMENNDVELPDSAQMVFAEQRLTAMFLRFKNYKIKTITDVDSCQSETTDFTHLGGLKGKLQQNNIAKDSYSIACAEKIKSTFPEFLDKLSYVKCLKKYF